MTDAAEIWAPRASVVELLVDGERLELEPTGGGWFRSRLALGAGTDYLVSLDGGPGRPDPRSHHQPYGVHGPTRVVDHEAFPWTDGAWRGRPLAGSAIYELHVGTFTEEGTFDGVIGRLDHLVELGVGFVELLPVAAFPGTAGWGYDGVALYAVHEPYGGPDGLKRLVDACHRRGLGVLLDVVLNHLGPDGNHLAEFGPYFTDAHHTPWGEALNLDQRGAHEVRAFLAGVCRHWFERYHVDGVRLDATDHLHDRSAVPFLEELSALRDEWAAHLGRTLLVTVENDRNDAGLVASREAGGCGLDAWWADDLHHALHAWLTGERESYYAAFGDPHQVARALRRGQVFDGILDPVRGHVRGRPVGALPAHRLVVCTQNHDQVGNRARGERLGQIAGDGAALAAATLVVLGPATPLIFQGEEWAASTPFPYVSDHEDPALAEAVRTGRRTEFAAFGWDPDDVLDPQDPATHRLGVLRWAEGAEGAHATALAWYRELLRLRRELPELTDGRLDRVVTEVIGDGAEAAIVLRRGRVTAVVNRAAFPVETTTGGEDVVLGPGRADVVRGVVVVPPASTVVCAPLGVMLSAPRAGP